MYIQELQSLAVELQGLGFKYGLTMFVEGAQGFHGNLRLLLDPNLFLEYERELFELIKRRELRMGFCFRSEVTFVIISSPQKWRMRA